MSSTFLFFLAIYIVVLGFSVVQIQQLVEEAVDELKGLLRLEEVAVRCDSAGISRDFIRGGLAIALNSFKIGFSKQMLVNQIWMCFMVTTCFLASWETFASEFKLDFKTSALKAYINALTEENKVVHVDLAPMIEGLSILLEETEKRG